ncbi:MAG: hypothetical protein BWX70_02940 [Verrucomicrobia bacterium ADurb.Bin070]|nr:MAG: hypothetical protein BWX70_02940 [Verrucomicrobia bacterium ADurb.Bin070]
MSSAERRHSFAYTKTVIMPVSRNAHQAQLPATPCVRTMSVTRFGVSHEKVQATIDTPSNHQGIDRPERKKSDALLLERRAAAEPTAMTESKKPMMIAASTHEIFNMPSPPCSLRCHCARHSNPHWCTNALMS